MLNVYEQVDRNKTRSTLIVLLFAVFITAAVYFIGRGLGYGPGFIGIALIVSGISSFAGYWYSDRIILTISKARPASKKQDSLFYSVVENISLGAGIPMPKLYIIDDSAPNAFATGRDIDHAVVCATNGLLQKLNRTELEGVIAHEISHIKNYDMRLMSVVTVLVGMVILLSDWALRSSFRRSSNNREGGQVGSILVVVGVVVALLSPLFAKMIQLALSRRRELLADAGSVLITRQPAGLISALKKLSTDKEPLEVANKATAHLFIVNPFSQAGNKRNFSSLFNTHPSVEERIKNLEAME